MKNAALPPHVQLGVMSRDYVISRSIHAIANLGIADHMSERPIAVTELAQKTDTVPELLERVLNFLTIYGLFIKSADGYALTPLSNPLRQDDPYSMKDILGMVDESWWQAFSHLETELKTGKSGFEQQHGVNFFDFLNSNQDKKANFEKGLQKLSKYDDEAIATAFDFGKFKGLIDIGAGKDSLGKTLKTLYPKLEVGLFDLASKLANKEDTSLFSGINSGDAYLFKGFLHDFNDEQIINILQSLRDVMDKKSSLLIAEQVIPDNDLPHTNRTMDIIMMVLVGGQQRTAKQWCELVAKAGFGFIGLYPSKGIYCVMEFSPI